MPSLPTALLSVMAGGGLGAALRYLVARALPLSPGGWPTATLLVNIVGGLAMGLLAGWLHGRDAEGVRLLLGVGVLGGFTTFSAFSLEMARMVEDGAFAMALGYALASVIAALLAVFVGLAAARAMA